MRICALRWLVRILSNGTELQKKKKKNKNKNLRNTQGVEDSWLSKY